MIDKLIWKKEYEVGVPVIDSQHRKLVEIAGSLYNAVSAGQDAYKRGLDKILKELGEYTEYHFSTEERLMKKYGYPGAETHKIAHRNFVSEISNQSKKIAHGYIDNGLQFYGFVAQWLLSHIAKSDKMLAEHLAKKAGGLEELKKASAVAFVSLSEAG